MAETPPAWATPRSRQTGLITAAGASALNNVMTAANGTVTVPASAVCRHLSAYRICAAPANAPLAAAVPVATMVVQGADMVNRITCT